MLRKSYLLIFIVIFGVPQAGFNQNSDLKLNTIVIDPGHGGKDPGTSVGKVLEKDIVLDVALKVGQYIQQDNPDIKVIYTRSNDQFIELNQRAEIANKNKADLFVSVHVNYYQSESTFGAETYILGNHRSEDNLKVAQLENSVILLEDDYSTKYEGFDPNSAESYIMFELIQNEFLEQSRYFADQIQNSFISLANRRSRGVKQAGFLVLRKTVMPSILIELGYISNAKEKEFLESISGRDQMAHAIAKAFINYKKRIDNRSSITISEPSASQISHTESNKIELSMNDKITTGKWYATQIIASKRELDTKQLGLDTNQFYFHLVENSFHKYFTGFTQDYSEALTMQNKLSLKFKGAFLVEFNEGRKTNISK